jgi:eukaryotic-like serine/threonine-protein kinase
MQSPNKYYTFSVPAGRFWKVYLPVALFIAIAGAAAGFYAVDSIIMPRVVGNERDVVEVPAALGLPIEEAREKFFAAGLLTEIRGRDYDNKVQEEAVVTQVPEPGSKVKKGRRISVVVSKGREFSVIPDVKDMTERQVRMELKKRGFQVGEVKKSFNDKHPAETVIELFPQSGSNVSRDMKVDIVISKGPKPTSAEMPNIVGENIDGARKKLGQIGLNMGKINYRNNRSLLPGTVISQSISPGENIPLETSVDMTVSVMQ